MEGLVSQGTVKCCVGSKVKNLVSNKLIRVKRITQLALWGLSIPSEEGLMFNSLCRMLYLSINNKF